MSKTLLKIQLILVFMAALLFNSNPAFAGFSQDDLTGVWYGHTLTVGDDEVWEHDIVTIDSQGNVSVEFTEPGGNTETESNVAVVSITSTGIMSEAANTSLQGIMSPDKKMVVFTDTWDEGATYALTILMKAGETYSQSDLSGTWYEHILATGSEEGWEYGTLTIDSSGSVSLDMTDSDGGTETISDAATVSINSSGIMSLNLNSDFHGVMSQDKNTVVITETYDDDPPYSTYSMSVAVKGGGTYAVTDLQGKWRGYSLTSAGTGNWQGWERSSISINDQGAFTLQSIYSDNGTDSASGTLSITSSGIITMNETGSTLHGAMNLDKDIVALTQTDDTSTEYSLMVLVKETDSAGFSADTLSGKAPLQVTFTDSSSGTISGWSWDFGDGTTSTQQNPSHTYSKPGKYTVTLTVTGESGQDVVTKTDYITVQAAGMNWLPILLDE